jgi:hypothetical protein
MGKTKISAIGFAFVIALLLAGCGGVTPAGTPTPKPPYMHYTPSEASNIHLEFDYPSSWIFSESTLFPDWHEIYLGDPRFSTLPTPYPYAMHPTPNDFGRIDVSIKLIKPGEIFDALVEPYKQGHINSNWIIGLNDYKITINGHSARVLEFQLNIGEIYSSMMFERSTFFAVNDQMYRIAFTIAEKDRGGEFEQGYEYFFKSLKIVP